MNGCQIMELGEMPPAAAEILLVDMEWQLFSDSASTGKTGATLSHDLWVRQIPCQAR